MSEPTPATEPTTNPAPTATPTPTPAPPAQEPTDWKAMARKWEAQAKENKTAADELAALKAAQLTEAEKKDAALAAAQAELDGYRQRDQIEKWKADVSAERPDLRELLEGTTEEGIRAHFERLSARIPAPQQSQQPTAQPVPTIGQTPATPSGNVSLKDQIAAAEKAGDRALVGALKAMQLSTT